MNIFLPALAADGALSCLPHFQTLDAGAQQLGKIRSGHAHIGPVLAEPGRRIALQEPAVIIQEVRHGNAVELRQPVRRLGGHLFCPAAFKLGVCAPADAGNGVDLLLEQAFAAPQPAEPVRNISDLGMAGVQRKLHHIKGRIPHAGIPGLGKDIESPGKPRQDPPVHRPAHRNGFGVRIAFSIQREA